MQTMTQTMTQVMPRNAADPILRPQGPAVPPEEVARIWRELALGQWRVVAVADADGRRHAVIAPLPKRVIRWDLLRRRERQVLEVAARGASQKAIAAELGLKASMVSQALRGAKGRLGFGSIAELLRAYEAGLGMR